jgi:hypothetical protein
MFTDPKRPFGSGCLDIRAALGDRFGLRSRSSTLASSNDRFRKPFTDKEPQFAVMEGAAARAGGARPFNGLVVGVAVDAHSTPDKPPLGVLLGLGDSVCNARLGDGLAGERECSWAMLVAGVA